VNSRYLHDLAHRAAGNYARAFRCGLQQNLRRAVTPKDLVRNRRTSKIELDQILFCLLDALLDRHRHFTSFAHAESRVTMMIADNHERRKAQVLAAFDHFGDAIDGDDVVLQIRRIDFEQPPHRETVPQCLLRHKLRTVTPLPAPHPRAP
jgi:hypothetical protein